MKLAREMKNIIQRSHVLHTTERNSSTLRGAQVHTMSISRPKDGFTHTATLNYFSSMSATSFFSVLRPTMIPTKKVRTERIAVIQI